MMCSGNSVTDLSISRELLFRPSVTYTIDPDINEAKDKILGVIGSY